VDPTFTALHRGGSGTPLVLLHGFADTWRTWELVLPMLERHHDVLAPTLAGHAGGPSLPAQLHADVLVEGVERAMAAAGFDTAHVVGNSLGGHVALQLAARGKARTVVAFAPAGGWADGDDSFQTVLDRQGELFAALRTAAPHADAIASTPAGRRRATRSITERSDHLPADLVAHLIAGVAGCHGAAALIERARVAGWPLDPAAITCPVRVVWGTADRLLPWPSAAERYRRDWLPHADWIELDGVGHAPQLDVPLEAAQLVLGFATP
jgi:pimeloyl-ACP methyl ester carboxylesterase